MASGLITIMLRQLGDVLIELAYHAISGVLFRPSSQLIGP